MKNKLTLLSLCTFAFTSFISTYASAFDENLNFEQYVHSSFDNIYHNYGTFNDGLASVYTDNTDYSSFLPILDTKSGFIDKNGVLFIPQDYSRVSDFTDGVAVAVKSFGNETKSGVIDVNNNVILDFAYDYIAPFNDGFTYVGNTGNVSDDTFDFTYGYIGLDGNFVTPMIYKNAGIYSEGFASVSLDFKTGTDRKSFFINMDNKTVINETFDYYNYFSEGLCAFALNSNTAGPYGYIDTLGNVVIEPIYAKATNFSEGYAVVTDFDGNYHLINTFGDVVFSSGKTALSSMSDGLILGLSDTKQYSFFDETGAEVISTSYSYACDFSEGLALVAYDSTGDGNTDKYGFIDQLGNEILPLIFDFATSFSDDLAIATIGDTAYVLNNPLTDFDNITKDVIKNASKVFVNGKEINFDSYTIDSNNYFKIRDLAFAFSGLNNNFDVSWNGLENAVELHSNSSYTVVGGELLPKDELFSTAIQSNSNFLLDGQNVAITAYTIDQNNYVKLRDICRLLNIHVSWDQVTNSINIHTGLPYTD